MKFDEKNIEAVSFDHDVGERTLSMPIISRINVCRRTTPPAAGCVPLIRHRHAFNCHEFFVLYVSWKECGMLLVSDRKYILNAGEAMLIFPGQSHVRVPLEHDTGNFIFIRFAASSTQVLNGLRNKKFKLNDGNIAVFNEILKIWNSGKSEKQDLIVAAKLQMLLMGLEEEIGEEDSISYSGGDRFGYVQELCELMMSKDLNGDPFDIVAAKWSVTPEYLRAVFSKTMGHPARYFINARKVLLAKRLLLNSTLTISEIAIEAGFKSVYAFSRFFQHHHGMPPREYRKKYKTDNPVSIVP